MICDIEGTERIDVHDTEEVAEAVWLTREQIDEPYKDNSLTNELISYFKYGDDFPNHKKI